MAKKVRYIYDLETCSFIEEKVTPGSLAKNILQYVGMGFVFACLFMSLYIFFYNSDPKHALLMSKNDKLQTKIEDYARQFAQLELEVDELQETDRNLYKSIMDIDPIKPGVWNGGSGGAANNNNTPDIQVLKNAESRLDILRNKLKMQADSYNMLADRFFESKDELAHKPSIKPVPGRLISGFGMRMHPIHNILKRHTGIDLQASTGTKVYATADGIIKYVGINGNGYGKHVNIDHGFGFETKYAHLSKPLVKKGQKVKRGDVIGLSGNTGLSKGPHLHYEIIRNGQKINPIDYFYSDLTPEEYKKLKKEAQIENASMD